jgi:alkylhydroperoxidase/carboxymuconolactone decarboxylase family protein YurZ
MDYREVLRRLTIGDTEYVESVPCACGRSLDPKTTSFARLGALVAIGANTSGFQSHVDTALAAGASVDEIVEVLLAVAPTVGSARVFLAAPALGLAVGYDTDAGLESLEPD